MFADRKFCFWFCWSYFLGHQGVHSGARRIRSEDPQGCASGESLFVGWRSCSSAWNGGSTEDFIWLTLGKVQWVRWQDLRCEILTAGLHGSERNSPLHEMNHNWVAEMKTNRHIGVYLIFWTTYFCKFVLIVTIIYNIWYISLYFDVHFLQEHFFIFQPVSIRLAAFPDVLLSPFRSLRSGRLLLLHQAQWGPSLVSMPRALLQRGLCTWPERASVTAAGLRSRPNPNSLVSM